MARTRLPQLLKQIRACTVCADLPHGPRPVVRAHSESRILIIGQAPGRRVHESGVPWDDPSGKRLRDWLGVDDQTFYDTTIRARKDWLVRTAGDLEENREDGDHRVWRYVLKQPCRVIGLAAGDYVTVEKEGEGGIALDALVFSGHEEGAKVLLDAAARAIKFYTDQYGPMSEKRFTLVEMPAAFGSGSG